MFAGNDSMMGMGGFLGDSTNEVDSPASKKKNVAKRHQSVTPVVIRQIRDNPDEEFKIFGTPTQILQLVGTLKDVEVSSTKATYTIEDHTASMTAIWWLENDDDNTSNLPAVREGSYVQVFGTLRQQDNDKVLMILKMFPVEDANIVTNHLLQVIHVRLQAEHAAKNASVNATLNNPGAQLVSTMSMYDENMPDNGQSDLTVMQQKVLRALQSNDSVSGAERSEVLRGFAPHQRREANDALEHLVNEGHAYTTIDSEHFKCTTFS